MAIHGRGHPAGFCSEENIGFVEEVDTIIEAKMEKIHPRGRGPLKLSAPGIEFPPYMLLILRRICDVGSSGERVCFPQLAREVSQHYGTKELHEFSV